MGGAGTQRDKLVFIFGNGHGGALFNRSGHVELHNCTFFSNTAEGGSTPFSFGGTQEAQGGSASGGAIHNLDQLQMVNCTVAENSANGGTGLMELLNSGGSAFGGALFNGLDSGAGFSSAANLVNLTIASNSVQFGTTPPRSPGVSGSPFSYPPIALGSSVCVTNGAVKVITTILVCAASTTNVDGKITDGGHNLCSDLSANFSMASSLSGVDPRLAPLMGNGGPTLTFALLPDSPAIDSGDSFVCPLTDQRGIPRPSGRFL
jgi:hypothetical protein